MTRTFTVSRAVSGWDRALVALIAAMALGGAALIASYRVDTDPCAAALRVGMGDSGAAEVTALRGPACSSLSADELAQIRARVAVELLREQQQ